MSDSLLYPASTSAAAAFGAQQLCQRTHHLNAAIRRFMPADAAASILDLGAGYGAFIQAALVMGYRNLEGCDHALERVKAAAALGVKSLIHGDLFEVLARQHDASRDAVISFDVIEHLTKQQTLDCADQVLRVLRPGGRWIIHTVNGESPYFGRIRYGDFTHESVFTPTSLDEVLRARGFSSVESYEDAPVVHGPASAVRWALWRMICGCMRMRVAVETGLFDRGAIYTQNFFALAFK
jgi:SAM-dependent methyltransferase